MHDEITYKLLKSIEENPSHSQRDLSRSLGMSLGKINYCLRALTDKGWVKAKNFSQSQDKTGYLYLLTPAGAEEKGRVTLRFLRRKMQEYEALKQEIDRLKQEAS